MNKNQYILLYTKELGNKIEGINQQIEELNKEIEVLNKEKEEMVEAIRAIEQTTIIKTPVRKEVCISVEHEGSTYDTRSRVEYDCESPMEQDKPYSNLDGINYGKNLCNPGEIFKYSLTGNFIAKYENSSIARAELEKEIIEKKGEEAKPVESRFIEYASKGTMNHSSNRCNHHKHKGYIWTDKFLTEDDLYDMRLKKIFK